MSLGKRLAPLWFLAMIPAQLLLDIGMLYVGTVIDEMIFNTADTLGHGIPIATAVALGAAVFFTFVVFIVSIVLTITNLVKRNKTVKKEN